MGKKENWKETGNSASWAQVRNLILFYLLGLTTSLLELNSLTYNT